jgi:hypothetical protein
MLIVPVIAGLFAAAPIQLRFLIVRIPDWGEMTMRKLARKPAGRAAISMMSKNPDLIRRPVVVAGGCAVVGYDENGMIRF